MSNGNEFDRCQPYQQRLLPNETYERYNRSSDQSSIHQKYAELGVCITHSDQIRLLHPAEDLKFTLLPKYLCSNLTNLNVIQRTLWPLWCCGTDLIISAAGEISPADIITPIIFHVMNQPLVEPWDSPIVLYVAATQMRTETIHAALCEAVSNGTKIRVGALMGPLPLGFDRAGYCPDIVVSTPGRLKNFETLLKGFNRTSLVIVDEWSTHYKAGFNSYLKSIINTKLRRDVHLITIDRFCYTSTHPLLLSTGATEDLKVSPKFVSLFYGKPNEAVNVAHFVEKEEKVGKMGGCQSVRFWSRNPSVVVALRYMTACSAERVYQDVCNECAGLPIIVEESKVDGPCRYRVFLDFGDGNEKNALQMFRTMHGRQYNGHTITAQFIDKEIFRAGNSNAIAEQVEAYESRTLLLRNVVNPDASQINSELRSELEEECSCFGCIESIRFVIVPKGHWEHEGEAVRVFLTYSSFEGAAEAMTNLDGRMFGGKAISAALYDEVRMHHNDLGNFREAESDLPLSSVVLS